MIKQHFQRGLYYVPPPDRPLQREPPRLGQQEGARRLQGRRHHHERRRLLARPGKKRTDSFSDTSQPLKLSHE